MVEDEDAIRNVCSRILTSQGYRLHQCATSEEALELAGRLEEPVHLLLTDVVLPGQSGRELASKMLTLRPKLKVLYISGYTDEVVIRHGILNSGCSFLQKPFSQEGLLAKVRSTLDQRPA